MTERLEEAKKYLESTYTDSNYEIALCEHIGIPRELLEHLIQQAELADLLVTDKSRVQLEKRVEELEKDIENYKKACTSWETVESYSRKEAQRYKQALEDIRNRESLTTGLPDGQRAFTMSGAIANKALEGEG